MRRIPHAMGGLAQLTSQLEMALNALVALLGSLIAVRTGTGLTAATSALGLGSPGTGLTPPTSAPGLAHHCHICAWTGIAPPTSAPGLGSPPSHIC
jgi:hypothetical protein